MSVWFRTAAAVCLIGMFARVVCALGGGACCDPDSCACTAESSATMCVSPLVFVQGGVCSPSPCIGSCCDWLSCACTTTSATQCVFPNRYECGVACGTGGCVGWCYNEFTGECTRTTLGDCEGRFNCLGCNLCNTACCDLSSGACIVTPACTCPPGTFLPIHGPCVSQPSPCGACCDATSGSCTPAHPSMGCAFGSVFVPSTSTAYSTCECPLPLNPGFPCANPCGQIGACCHATACSVAVAATCTGEFQGASSACGTLGNPTTCCPCNIDGVNGLEMKDVFDFLSMWLASDPKGDFNHDGVMAVQDIIDFVGAWFQGC